MERGDSGTDKSVPYEQLTIPSIKNRVTTTAALGTDWVRALPGGTDKSVPYKQVTIPSGKNRVTIIAAPGTQYLRALPAGHGPGERRLWNGRLFLLFK